MFKSLGSKEYLYRTSSFHALFFICVACMSHALLISAWTLLGRALKLGKAQRSAILPAGTFFSHIEKLLLACSLACYAVHGLMVHSLQINSFGVAVAQLYPSCRMFCESDALLYPRGCCRLCERYEQCVSVTRICEVHEPYGAPSVSSSQDCFRQIG